MRLFRWTTSICPTLPHCFTWSCLADLQKKISSNSTPEQLVGSLADRTPDSQAYPNVHHAQILKAELARRFDMKSVYGRVMMAGGEPVQLGNKKGVVYRKSPEQDALERWMTRQFLDVGRNMAKAWRRALQRIDFAAMLKSVMGSIGTHGENRNRWRTPKTSPIPSSITWTRNGSFRFGLDLLGVPEAADWVITDWIERRRPSLRDHLPYFVFLLTVNLFFCLVLPTRLLRNVKPSHQIHLAYLYYLPFCSVFTSKDNFHAQIVPLFLDPFQTFVNGTELKE